MFFAINVNLFFMDCKWSSVSVRPKYGKLRFVRKIYEIDNYVRLKVKK